MFLWNFLLNLNFRTHFEGRRIDLCSLFQQFLECQGPLLDVSLFPGLTYRLKNFGFWRSYNWFFRLSLRFQLFLMVFQNFVPSFLLLAFFGCKVQFLLTSKFTFLSSSKTGQSSSGGWLKIDRSNGTPRFLCWFGRECNLAPYFVARLVASHIDNPVQGQREVVRMRLFCI